MYWYYIPLEKKYRWVSKPRVKALSHTLNSLRLPPACQPPQRPDRTPKERRPDAALPPLFHPPWRGQTLGRSEAAVETSACLGAAQVGRRWPDTREKFGIFQEFLCSKCETSFHKPQTKFWGTNDLDLVRDTLQSSKQVSPLLQLQF